MGKATCIVGWGGEGSEFAIGLGQATDGDYLGSLYHPEQLTNAKQDVSKLLEAGRDVAILGHAGMLCCQHVFQSIAYFRDITLYREMTLFLEYYVKNSVAYQMLREARSKASEELWLDDRYREKVMKGIAEYWASPAGIARRKELSEQMLEYWASDEGVERREYQRTDEFLAPLRANGFQDGDRISKGASRRSGGIAVLWRLHAIDARRLQERRSWVVSFSTLRPFEPTSSLLSISRRYERCARRRGLRRTLRAETR